MDDKLVRILIYSHDTFGLGHLRRCRTIAHALVRAFSNVEVSIISGSLVADAYSYRERVNFIQIPATRKLPDGNYTSADSDKTLEQTIREREAIIMEAAERLNPDLVIVDKEPFGLRREMLGALKLMKARGTITVLGLRDVLDAPDLLSQEWRRKQIMPMMGELFDHIWIYGPREFYHPLAGLGLPDHVMDKCTYTGFLPRRLSPAASQLAPEFGRNFVLVTAGGGGDGFDMMVASLAAVQQQPLQDEQFLFLFGPFMTAEERRELLKRAANIANVKVLEFHENAEALVEASRAVIGMCGYNTFCEVISFDKPALFVPRTAPRREQSIRAERARALGWCDAIDLDLAHDTARYTQAIHQAIHRPAPSTTPDRPDLKGLIYIRENVLLIFPDRLKKT